MAQYPKIRLEFTAIPQAAGEMIYISIGGLYITARTTFTNPPGYKEYLIGQDLSECAQSLLSSLNIHYSTPFVFESVAGLNAVDITCQRYDLGNFSYSIQNNQDFNVTTTPVIAPVEFYITGLSYSAATGNKCDNVKVAAAIENGASPYIARAIYNGSIQETKTTSNEADLFFDFPRYTAGSRRIEIVSDGVTKSIDVPVIQRINTVAISISYTEFQATVTVNPVLSVGVSVLPAQFSVDDITYQSSNVFQFSVSGDYTAYVIDKYGCKKSAVFTIDLDERKPDPYFKIEITNPLRAVDQSYAGVKNITNQLSADYDISNVESRFYRQPFRIGDIIRTQFKSNYEAHAVKIYDCDDVLVDTLTPTLKIQNTNQLDKRDALVITAGSKANVAFLQGNIYDPVTGDITDDYFQSNGRLPSFVRVGMLITFDAVGFTGTFEVEDIVYNETIQAWACVIDANYIGSDTLQALNTYNLEEYNIYEVEIALPAGQYYAVFEATDSSTLYTDQGWKTEPFWIDNSEVVVIDYSSETNEALIDYRTNIEFRLCIPGRFAKYQPDVQGEEFRDDLGNIYLQKSTYNRVWTIETDLMPWWLAEKVMIASRHKILKVNGIDVVNTEAPEVTDRIGERNPFYQITGIYQENIDISIADETGIISGARGILSGNENQVIGI